jgi:hypothetical protein
MEGSPCCSGVRETKGPWTIILPGIRPKGKTVHVWSVSEDGSIKVYLDKPRLFQTKREAERAVFEMVYRYPIWAGAFAIEECGS